MDNEYYSPPPTKPLWRRMIAVLSFALKSALILVGVLAIMLLAGLFKTPVDKRYLAALAEIRDICGDKIIAAYQLMESHAPEGAWDSPLAPYYPGSEEAKNSWNAEAYEIISQLRDPIGEILLETRDSVSFGFVFKRIYAREHWYIQLVTNISTSHESVSLIYFPHEPANRPWKPLDEQAGWYYEVLDRV